MSTHKPLSYRAHRRRGFTLVEALTAAAILAFVVAAITQAITAGQTQTYEALHDARGMALAEAMLEEVLAMPYADLDESDSESTRATFDDMDDYHGLNETAGNVVDANGAAYPDTYNRFSRVTTVDTGSVTVSDWSTTINGKTVTVVVTDDRGRTWSVAHFVPESAE